MYISIGQHQCIFSLKIPLISFITIYINRISTFTTRGNVGSAATPTKAHVITRLADGTPRESSPAATWRVSSSTSWWRSPRCILGTSSSGFVRTIMFHVPLLWSVWTKISLSFLPVPQGEHWSGNQSRFSGYFNRLAIS